MCPHTPISDAMGDKSEQNRYNLPVVLTPQKNARAADLPFSGLASSWLQHEQREPAENKNPCRHMCRQGFLVKSVTDGLSVG